MTPNLDRHIGTVLHDQNGDQRYILQKRLGEGATGAVYRGLDRRDQRSVAVKVVESTISPNHVAEFAKEGGRFQQEVLTVQGLEHPHIVPLLGSGVDRQSGLFYLVMDIAEGGSLRERIKQLRRLTPHETVLHIHQAASALQYAHDHHTIHSDVKPDNLLLKNIDGSWVLVSDFGIAGVKHDPKTVVTGGFQGTLLYASPEQVKGKPTKFTDQWALAVTAYEALTGARPFQQADVFALATGQNVEPPTFLDLGITDALHVKLEGVLRRGLKKDQEERYAEITELAKELEENFLLVASDPEKRIFLAAKIFSLPNLPQADYDLHSAPTVDNRDVELENTQRASEEDIRQQAKKWFYIGLTLLMDIQDGLTDASQENHEEMLRAFNEATRLNPNYTRAFLKKGHILSLLNRQEEAQKAFTRAQELEREQNPQEKPGTTIAIYRGHTHCVSSVAWSPDGKRIASGSWDETVRVWAVDSGDLICEYRRHSSMVYSIAWSSDGKWITSFGGKMHKWEARTGEIITEYGGRYGMSDSVAWSPDGNRLASVSGRIVQVWAVDSGELITQYWNPVRPGRRTIFAWSPDGKRIASGSGSSDIHVWNVSTGEVFKQYEAPFNDVYSIAWSPDGKRIALGCSHTVCALDHNTGETIICRDDNPIDCGAQYSVTWSPDGRYIASGSRSFPNRLSDYMTAQIWEAGTGELITQYQGHSSNVFSVAWSPDGTKIASGSTDKTVHVWVAPK